MNAHLNEEESFSFPKDLNVKLLLESDGKKEEIFAGNIEEANLDLHSYGYDAQVKFSAFDQEEIHQLFSSEKMIKATLTFISTDPEKAGTPLLEIQGIVYKRSYQARPKGVQKKQARFYEIRFTDPAKISWNAHFPIKIFVDQTMKDVIDAEKNPLISIKYDWDALNEARPIIAYSLAFKRGLPEDQQVSFYSFLMWHLEQGGGIFEYNYKENSYSILGKKDEAGEPINVAEWCITQGECEPADPTRHHKRVIKHSADHEDHQDEENPNGFQAVRKDAFDDANYHLYPEQITQATHSAFRPEKPILKFSVSKLEDPFGLDQIVPGVLIAIKGDEKVGGDWSEQPEVKDQNFRLRDVSIRARKTTASESVKKTVQPYQLEIRVAAESKDETYIARPPFKDPVYPFHIPGKIFGEIGDKEQTTYNIVKKEKAPLGFYQVIVPLAGNDKKVIAPFTPDGRSGKNHLPHTKDLEVMLAIYFQTAKIVEVIGFDPLTQPPPDTQIQQTVFASNGKDKFVRQRHEYKGKDSIFSIQQSSSADQTQTFQIKEKDILITVEEKGKNTVQIQFNRESGLTVKVKDDASGVTQQTVYNSTAIVHTSEGKDGKTTLTQTPTSVSIETKQFNVKCEEGTIEASKILTHKAANKIFLDAPVINAKDKVKMGG